MNSTPDQYLKNEKTLEGKGVEGRNKNMSDTCKVLEFKVIGRVPPVKYQH